MAVIIGAGTTVSADMWPASACVISANWAYNPNSQRLYCLGEWAAYDTIKRPTQTLNIVIYSQGSISQDIQASTSCTTITDVAVGASVTPASCAGAVAPFSYNDWVIVSYGYSKDDPLLSAQESWGLQRWATGAGITAPSHVIRGIAEGSVTIDVEGEAGMVFSGATDEGTQGSVSAGAVGRADTTKTGVVTAAGNSQSVSGHIGTGSVSVPYTPLWLE